MVACPVAPQSKERSRCSVNLESCSLISFLFLLVMSPSIHFVLNMSDSEIRVEICRTSFPVLKDIGQLRPHGVYVEVGLLFSTCKCI